MNNDLDKRFKGKYGFLEKRLPASESYDCYGFECGAGWGDLLEWTFNLIQHRIENPKYQKERFFTLKTWYNNIFWNKFFYPLGKFLFLRNIPKTYSATEMAKYRPKWDKYNKWQKFFCANPHYVKPEYGLEFKVQQIKEKFGGLRFYYSAYYKRKKWFGLVTEYKHDEYIKGVIAYAEGLSYKTCECCGSNQNVSQNKRGWIKTYCADCRKDLKK